jgi:hypothetical protein
MVHAQRSRVCSLAVIAARYQAGRQAAGRAYETRQADYSSVGDGERGVTGSGDPVDWITSTDLSQPRHLPYTRSQKGGLATCTHQSEAPTAEHASLAHTVKSAEAGFPGEDILS